MRRCGRGGLRGGGGGPHHVLEQEGGEDAGADADDEGAGEDADEEAEGPEDGARGDGLGLEGNERGVEHDGDSVVEHGLAEYDGIEVGVSAQLGEDGEHRHRVDGGDESAEDEGVDEVHVEHYTGHAAEPDENARDGGGDGGSDEGQGADGAKVPEEETLCIGGG